MILYGFPLSPYVRKVAVAIKTALDAGLPLAIPTGVLAQVWRDGRRQARIATLASSGSVELVPLDPRMAKAVGQLLGVRRKKDVVDGSVALCARERGHVVLTSDPDDLAALEPGLRVVRV